MRTKIIVGILLVGFIVAFVATCNPVDYFPKEGVWYCRELEMQLDFFGSGNSFIVVDSEKILCDYTTYRGSDVLFVSCQEYNCELYSLGEEILSMRFVSLDDTTLITKALKSDTIYTFTRIG